VIAHERLRIYGLSGRTTFIAWCRDAKNDWKTELLEGKKPDTLTDVQIDLSRVSLSPESSVRLYNPWTDSWRQSSLRDGIVNIASLRRSVVVRIEKK